jgi:hypothetical protein
MCYRTVFTDSKMSDSDITCNEADKFAEEDDCGIDVDCFTQPTEPNDFVLLNVAAKKTVRYFVRLIQDKSPDDCKTRFLRKRLACWIFCFPETEDTVVLNLTAIVLKLPHPVVSGSNCRTVTMIFGMNLSGCKVK